MTVILIHPLGELFDKIAKQKRLDICDAARTVKQVLSGTNYMHRKNIVHRDLKPENLLLENNSADALIKIIDFGLSAHFQSQSKMKDKIGTYVFIARKRLLGAAKCLWLFHLFHPFRAYYIAPEVLAGSYTEKCDIWSIGVILYILITG